MENKKIAILFREFLGDYHFLTPFLYELKRFYPDYDIHLYTTPLVQLMAPYHPAISEVYDTDEISVSTLKKRRYDIVYFTNWDYFSVAFFSGIKTIIREQETLLFRLFCKGMPTSWRRDDTRHAVERHIANLEYFFQKRIPADQLNTHLNIPDTVLTQPANFDEKGYIVLCPDTHSSKNFHREFYQKLINILSEEFKQRIILVGLKDPLNLMDDMPDHINIRGMIGQTNLHELMRLIKDCDAFFGIDSGPAHIAASFNKKGIVFYPPKGAHPYLTHGFSTALFDYKLPADQSDCNRYCYDYTQCAYGDCYQDYRFEGILPLLKRVFTDTKPRTFYEKKLGVFDCEFHLLTVKKLQWGVIKTIMKDRIKVVVVERNILFYLWLRLVQWFLRVTERWQFVTVYKRPHWKDREDYLRWTYTQLTGKQLDIEY